LLTRDIEFDFVSWTINALGVKLSQSALGAGNYMTEDNRHALVVDYLELVSEVNQAEYELRLVYSDPDIQYPEAASAGLRIALEELYERRAQLAPFAETVLQDQLGVIASDLGLSVGGQPIPPVFYHTTSMPWALIVSPRDEIRQEFSVNLLPEITVDEHSRLEDQVDQALDRSSLVVGIGGVGTYPTMVSHTTSLNWLTEVVAHEWTHNFLTLRPLGINYMTSPELRTMNETAASIAGKEMGLALLERFYPEFVPPPPPPVEPSQETGEESLQPEVPVFDFQTEMRITRENVDAMLADGKVEEAEAYMERRREFFWQNGYQIRKLNQAYFAFYGAYADMPGGAAGEDPVGEAVRELRDRSPSLAAFLNRISWMSSFEGLLEALENPHN
jgi:hypothetical protein